MHPETASIDFFGYAWRLGATLFFVLLNGFFVAAEFALVKVRRARIEQLASTGVAAAVRVRRILRHLDLYLSACQLGITLSSLVLGALGEPVFSRLLTGVATGLGLDIAGSTWLPWVSIGLAFAIITILHMTVGEQAPKMWALDRSESTALTVGGALHGFTVLFRPFIRLINWLSNLILRLFGLPPGDHAEDSASLEELKSILISSAGAGHLHDKQLDIAKNVLRLMDLEVRHIMIPRMEVEILRPDRAIEGARDVLRGSRHSRYPLCERDLDSIIGFIHRKELLERLLEGDDVDLRAISQPATYVPDTMALVALLRELQSSRTHVAAVVDEHGTTKGLVFREDVLEVIVGPLGDEFDVDHHVFEEMEDGSYQLTGRMPLPALFERLGLTPDEDEGVETAGGYLVAKLGRMPRPGDSVRFAHLQMTALAVARRRVTRLAIRPVGEPGPEDDAG